MPTRKSVSAPDIRFPDERLNRIVQHLRGLTQEVQKLQAVIDGGAAAQVLTKQSTRTYDIEWSDPAGGGSAQDGENLGEGAQVFKQIVDETFQFRTLVEGANITITQDGEEVTITATSSISVAWDDITGKPSTFPPSAHTQAATTVTFNNTGTGLVATNAQAAIAELASAPPGSYTDEDAQDAVGGILTSTTTITLTYSDGGPSITADVNEAALLIDWSQLDNIPTFLADFLAVGDPNADRILFWDDSTGMVAWLTAGTGLSITGTTLTATASSPPSAACAFTVTALASLLTTNLTTEGTIDWIVPNGSTSGSWDYSGMAAVGRKGAGGFITRLSTIYNGAGAWTGTFSASGNNWQGSFSAGDSANTTASGTYSTAQFISCNAGEGFVFVVPADTTSKYLRIYVSNATPYKVVVTMSDGSTFSQTGIVTGNAQILLVYNATRDGCQMNVQVIKESSSGNLGFMGATLGII